MEPKRLVWDREGEAARFQQECSWALRWGMWPEAYAAAESAWLLGLQTEPVATVKLKALREQMASDSFKTREGISIFLSNPGLRFDPVRDVMWTISPPVDRYVGIAIEAASFFAGISRLPETTWSTNQSWVDLGSNVLATASSVLRHQYYFGWPSNTFHPDLRILREATRNLASVLPPERVRSLLFRDGAFWQDASTATVSMYREAFETSETDDAMVFSRDMVEPFWIAWTPADRENGNRQWAELIASLQDSTNRTFRARAALLKLH
jgi:hypothetical protein